MKPCVHFFASQARLKKWPLGFPTFIITYAETLLILSTEKLVHNINDVAVVDHNNCDYDRLGASSMICNLLVRK